MYNHLRESTQTRFLKTQYCHNSDILKTRDLSERLHAKMLF